jgi:hypothetical protein
LTKVNWGAFIDEDKYEVESLYQKIDCVILGMVHDVCIPFVIEAQDIAMGFKKCQNNNGAYQEYKEDTVNKITSFKENGGLQFLLPGFFYKQIVKKRSELHHPKSVWKQMKLEVTTNVQPIHENFSSLVVL